MRTKLSDLVRTLNGDVARLSDLIDRGDVTLNRVANFHGDRGTTRVAYFADHKDGGCWEISRIAYESRTEVAS